MVGIYMIEECNFKGIIHKSLHYTECSIGNMACVGEENCILFQIYKWNWLKQPISNEDLKKINKRLKKSAKKIADDDKEWI